MKAIWQAIVSSGSDIGQWLSKHPFIKALTTVLVALIALAIFIITVYWHWVWFPLLIVLLVSCAAVNDAAHQLQDEKRSLFSFQVLPKLCVSMVVIAFGIGIASLVDHSFPDFSVPTDTKGNSVLFLTSSIHPNVLLLVLIRTTSLLAIFCATLYFVAKAVRDD
ncbi:MAG: hypothetical protein IT422_15090 [Pirellulaceae bacterium]|nr:hypothetical protein [Pirellulaceae bacterium]